MKSHRPGRVLLTWMCSPWQDGFAMRSSRTHGLLPTVMESPNKVVLDVVSNRCQLSCQCLGDINMASKARWDLSSIVTCCADSFKVTTDNCISETLLVSWQDAILTERALDHSGTHVECAQPIIEGQKRAVAVWPRGRRSTEWKAISICYELRDIQCSSSTKDSKMDMRIINECSSFERSEGFSREGLFIDMDAQGVALTMSKDLGIDLFWNWYFCKP